MKYKIKRIENMSLSKQLVLVTLVALLVCSIILGIILPKILTPFYEKTLYKYLAQPAKFIGPGTNKMSEDIAFIIITNAGAVYTSTNLNEIVPNMSYEKIINEAKESKGKFEINSNTYYYLWGEKKGQKNLIITDKTQIKEQEKSLLGIIFPTMIATITVTIMLLVTWSQYVLRKIKKIDKKTKALITKEKVDDREFIIDDELNELINTIDEVNLELKKKDEYKNMMFQTMSHELKTPISVIESYIEGVQDNVISKEEALKVISDETKILYSQVNNMLQFNKIDYIKDSKTYENSVADLNEIITYSIQTYKILRNDVHFEYIIEDDKELLYRGTEDMWKLAVDNILSNFIRFARSKIIITISSNKISFFNDGEKIEKEVLDKLFLPFVKGKKGQTGLGLSIVKKVVNLFEYDIEARNVEDGVLFVIK